MLVVGASPFESGYGDRILDADCVGRGPMKMTRNGRAFQKFTCDIDYDYLPGVTRGVRVVVIAASFLPAGWTWTVR